jgi:hypothetical protein
MGLENTIKVKKFFPGEIKRKKTAPVSERGLFLG